MSRGYRMPPHECRATRMRRTLFGPRRQQLDVLRTRRVELVRIMTNPHRRRPMKTLPLAEVKAKLSRLVDQVAKTDDQIVITRNGRPAAVLVSPDEYDSWRETQAIRSDRELMAEIRRGLRALKQGSRGSRSDPYRPGVGQGAARRAGGPPESPRGPVPKHLPGRGTSRDRAGRDRPSPNHLRGDASTAPPEVTGRFTAASAAGPPGAPSTRSS